MEATTKCDQLIAIDNIRRSLINRPTITAAMIRYVALVRTWNLSWTSAFFCPWLTRVILIDKNSGNGHRDCFGRRPIPKVLFGDLCESWAVFRALHLCNNARSLLPNHWIAFWRWQSDRIFLMELGCQISTRFYVLQWSIRLRKHSSWGLRYPRATQKDYHETMLGTGALIPDPAQHIRVETPYSSKIHKTSSFSKLDVALTRLMITSVVVASNFRCVWVGKYRVPKLFGWHNRT